MRNHILRTLTALFLSAALMASMVPAALAAEALNHTAIYRIKGHDMIHGAVTSYEAFFCRVGMVYGDL